MKLTRAEKLVDRVLREQRSRGRAEYGQGLEHDLRGYDWRMEAVSELVDAVQYLAAEVLKLEDRIRELEEEEG